MTLLDFLERLDADPFDPELVALFDKFDAVTQNDVPPIDHEGH